jgi:hypothetical protein
MFRRASANLLESMNLLSSLQTQAISAAEKNDWKLAIQANTAILAEEPGNVSALNRLGFCYLQQGDQHKAKKTYTTVLEIDAANSIARKYLELLSQKTTTPFRMTTRVFQESFIEEPGKTKTVALCRVADPSILTTIPVGTQCKLVIKLHRISVETEDSNTYLGSLPDDLSHTLTKLIKGGNTYKTVVKSSTKTSCIVFIKELMRSKKQIHIISFPSSVNARISHMHEELLIDQSPVDVSETGQEREVSMDDFEERDDSLS